MRFRSLGIAALAIGAAAPAVAQQTPGSQQQARQQQTAHQQVEAWLNQWTEAYNRGDARTVLAMNDPSACTITATGLACGQRNVEQVVTNVMKLGPRFTMNVAEVRPISPDAALAAGSYRVTYTNNPVTSQAEGNWLRVFQREGNEWKSVASSFTPLAPPAPAVATGNTAAQPSTGTSTPPAAAPAPAAGPKYDPVTGAIK